tara:strand:+ start:266 stop:901 length:636 start_codon:yes stop_codon:yes gene_type:complete
MSTTSQTIVELDVDTTYQLSNSEACSTSTESSQMSSSDTAALRSAFPDSPLHSGDITDSLLKASFMSYAQGHDSSAEDGDENTISNDEGYWGITYTDSEGGTASGFDPNYTAAPDITSVTDPDTNTIANPYVPNPVSPGESWRDAPRDFSSRPAVPEWYTETTMMPDETEVYSSARTEWGSGEDLPNPSETSSDIASQTLETISSLMGTSS